MSRLTVTEKEHWKSRIENRIRKAITLLEIQEPGLMGTIEAEAKLKAHKVLGVDKQLEKIAVLQASIKQMQEQEVELTIAMRAKALGRERKSSESKWEMESEFSALVTKQKAKFEEELLLESPVGKEVLRLRVEMESLLDTVWLATSSVQIRDLWMRVSSVIGDEATELQQRILASTSDENKSE